MEELIESFTTEASVLWNRLQNGEITAIEWQDRMETLIARYHIVAWMDGADSEEIDEDARTILDDLIAFQIGFLAAFTVTILSAVSWKEGWGARALLYPPAIKVAYWKAKTYGLPLPSMPAEGTICMNNCQCQWRIVAIDADAGDYDAYWERHVDDSCQTCLEREDQWSPVQIRDGMLLEGALKESGVYAGMILKELEGIEA